MPSPPARRVRAAGLLPILLVASCALIAVVVIDSGRTPAPRTRSAAASTAARFHTSATTPSTDAPTSSTTTSTPPTTSTTTTTTAPAPQPAPAPPPPVPTTTTTTPPPPPVETPAVQPATGIPPAGQATAWGCAAALAYLTAYAYPGFALECPGDAQGRQGMTCIDEPGACPGEHLIAIADACPQAYMNEASNSWVLMGRSDAPIDPYGAC